MMDRFLKLGSVLLSLPMLVFPVFHFLDSAFVASIVPPWIPWHLFWTYFTGVTIMAAGDPLLQEARTFARDFIGD